MKTWEMGEETSNELTSILEAGHVIIASYPDHHGLFFGADIQAIQDGEAELVAVFSAGTQGFNLAKLCAAMIAQLCPNSELNLPDIFAGEVLTAAELLSDQDPGATGNVGTSSDSVDVKILDSTGREFP